MKPYVSDMACGVRCESDSPAPEPCTARGSLLQEHRLSVIVPLRDERENVASLLSEVHRALDC